MVLILHTSKDRVLASLLLVGALVLAPFSPIATAGHDQPQRILDEVSFEGDDGYVAWRIDVSPPEGESSSWVYLDLANHTTDPYRFEDATHAHLGVWMASLDLNYVWWAVGATYLVDDGHATLNLKEQGTSENVAVPGEVEDEGWAYVDTPAGEWLLLVFWVTDGYLEADATLSGETRGGDPLVTVQNRTTGGEVFAFHESDFDGERNVNVATASAGFPDVNPWNALPQSAQASWIEAGSVTVDIHDRFFGLYTIPGNLDSHGGWTGPPGEAEGEEAYWFHGATPGDYDFFVDERQHVGERAPITVFGADVQIPTK